MERRAKRRHAEIVLILSAVMTGSLFCGPSTADTLTTTEIQITNTPLIELLPTLGDDGTHEWVVFTQRDTSGLGRIIAQRLDSMGNPFGAPINISLTVGTPGTDDGLNDISGSRIIFSALSSVGQGLVYVYDMSTGISQYPNSQLDFLREARIEGDHVAWVGGPPGQSHIMYTNLSWSTSTPPVVLDDPFGEGAPPSIEVEISSNLVVWTEQTTPFSGAIIAYNLNTAFYYIVDSVVGTAEAPARIGGAATSGAWVVYETEEGETTQIVATKLDLSAGSDILETRVVATGTSVADIVRRPYIDGDTIVYESNAAGNFDLYLYRLSDGSTFQVTSDPADQRLANIFGNKVAYVDFGSGVDTDIWLSTLTFSPDGPAAPIEFRDRTAFEDAAGALTLIDFDRDPCGNAIAASSPGVAAHDRYLDVGVDFAAGVIFDTAALGDTPPSLPNVISNSSINTPTPALVDGTFSVPVSAVGITNLGAVAELRIFDAADTLIGSIRAPDDDTSTQDFLGLISSTPIHRFEFDFVSGIGFSGDDLLYTEILTFSDTTPPNVTVIQSPGPNTHGWNRGNVTATIQAADECSGVEEIHYELTGAQSGGDIVAGDSASEIISAEGSTDLVYSAVDRVGNTTAASTITVRIDKTPPTIASNQTPAPNAAGWNNSIVTVNFVCADALSGVTSCSAPAVISTEGPNQAVGGIAEDAAGNTASTTHIVNLDKTAPTILAPTEVVEDATDPSGAFVDYLVTVTDNLDPAPGVSCAPASGSFFLIGTTTVNCTAADIADNSAAANFAVIVKGAAEQIQDLRNLVMSFNLMGGIENSLDTKLQSLLEAIEANKVGDKATACNKLNSFIQHVMAQSGKQLTVAQADQLLEAAQRIKAVLGCP